MAWAMTAIGGIDYDIPRSSLAAGEAASFTCRVESPQQQVYGVGIDLYVTGVQGYQIFRAAGAVSAGGSGTVHVPVTLDGQRLAQMSSRGGAMTARFRLYTNAELSAGSASEVLDLGMMALKNRIAPAIGAVTFSDASGAKDRFGDFVQGQSLWTVSAAVVTDPLAGDVTVASRQLTLGGRTFDLEQPGALGTIDRSGTLAWSLTVADSEGMTDSASGTVDSLPYAPPAIAQLSAERYRAQVADDGAITYVQADDGEHVRFTLQAEVCAVAGANAWSLAIAHGGANVTPLSAEDGQTIDREDDRTLVTAVIPANERRVFTFTLSDWFASATAVAAVEKASAYFDIEPHGVGVGMRAQGTAQSPRFDVGWLARMRGGIEGVTVYSESEQPTGGTWVDGRPVYRRTYLTSFSQSDAFVPLGTLPEDCAQVVRAFGMLYTGTQALLIPNAFYQSLDYMAAPLFDGANISLALGPSFGTNAKSCALTVEYVKAQAT